MGDTKVKDSEYVLETHNICKYYGSLKANDHVSLKVKRNTIHAIVGENGAGKSTLMGILTDIVKPDYGEIILNGEKVVFSNPMDAAHHGIGMIYQEFMLAPHLSVFENIIVGFEEKNKAVIDYKKSRERVEEICKKYHFDLPLDELIDELPVAMKQQIEIVKVLYRGADLIIMDEPTSVLTPQGIESLFDAMRTLKAAGKTILFITHKLKEVFAISDEITVLRMGKVVGTYNPANMNQQKLANLMVGREVILQADKQPAKLGEVVLDVKNLSVSDDAGVQRIKNVSFQIRSGEILGIAGVAGSGQQYLVSTIFGLNRADPGSKIEYLGHDITNQTPRELRKKKIGYVPQDRMGTGCDVQATIWENTIMGYHRSHGFNPKWLIDRKEAETFTKRVVENFAVKVQSINDNVGSLSGGNIQKLIVGREFSQENKLLLIEDPTRGIDVGAIEYIWAKLLQFANQGAAVLLVSHELNEVMELSDRIMVMFDGQLKDGGKHNEYTEQQLGLLMTGGEIS
jgi:ABC-type uncharacterized transport system ATPase subunit